MTKRPHKVSPHFYYPLRFGYDFAKKHLGGRTDYEILIPKTVPQKKPKFDSSMTATETINKTNHADNQIHSGVDHQKHKVVLKPYTKQVFRNSAINIHYRDCMLNLTGRGPGLTYWKEGLYLDVPIAWTGSTTANSESQGVVPYFDLNPYRNIPGSTLYLNITPAADRYALMTTRTIIDVCNFTSYPSFVKIHVMECISNSNNGPLVVAKDAEDASRLGEPTITYPVAAASAAKSGSVPLKIISGGYGASAEGLIGHNPCTVENLRKYWKRKKVISMELAGGGSERVTLEVVHNSVRSQEYLSSAPPFIKGTVCLLYEITGGLGRGQDANQPVIHFTPEVGVSQKIKHNFKCVKAGANRLPTINAEQFEATVLTVAPKQVSAVDTAVTGVLLT